MTRRGIGVLAADQSLLRGEWRLDSRGRTKEDLWLLPASQGGACGLPPEGLTVVEWTPGALRRLTEEEAVRTLVVCPGLSLDPEQRSELAEASLRGAEFRSFSWFCRRHLRAIPASCLAWHWLVSRLDQGPRAWVRVKELTERILALLALILLTPILALTALAIILTDGFPAIFRQERMGRFKVPFQLLKFRTMVKDAEAGSGPQWAEVGDPRITRLGGFLRAAALDELPQLWNVVRGEMSFFGPRPIRDHFADHLRDESRAYDARFLVRPGITGWAQAHLGYCGSVPEQLRKLDYEVYGLAFSSPGIRLETLWRTLRRVLRLRVGSNHDQT